LNIVFGTTYKKINVCQVKPLHIKQKREKELLRVYKKRNAIRKEIRALGYVKLAAPIRHGWFKEIAISKKIERYKSQAIILELYDVIEKQYWGRTKEEAHKKWLRETSRCLIYRDFPTISKKTFNKLSLKAQAYCTPFIYKVYKKLKLRFYIRVPKAAFRIKFTRAYVTHSKRIDPALESESDLLGQQLLKRGYYKIHQRSYKWKDHETISEEKKKRLNTNRALRKLKGNVLEDIINENISWEIN
jgi:hypothetical protein